MLNQSSDDPKMPDGKRTWHIFSSTFWRDYEGHLSLECVLSLKLPEPQVDSLLQALFSKQEMGLVSLMVRDWLLLFLLCYLQTLPTLISI